MNELVASTKNHSTLTVRHDACDVCESGGNRSSGGNDGVSKMEAQTSWLASLPGYFYEI